MTSSPPRRRCTPYYYLVPLNHLLATSPRQRCALYPLLLTTYVGVVCRYPLLLTTYVGGVRFTHFYSLLIVLTTYVGGVRPYHSSLLLKAYGLRHTAHYSLLTTHYSLLTAHYPPLTIHYSLLTVHYLLLTAHYSLLTAHCSLLTAHCSLLTIYCSLLITQHRLLTNHYVLFTTHYLLLTTHHSEVYAFGIVAWEVLTAGLPWEGATETGMMKAVVMKEERPPLSISGGSAILVPLVGRCWAQEPCDRPSFAEVCEVGELATATSAGGSAAGAGDAALAEKVDAVLSMQQQLARGQHDLSAAMRQVGAALRANSGMLGALLQGEHDCPRWLVVVPKPPPKGKVAEWLKPTTAALAHCCAIALLMPLCCTALSCTRPLLCHRIAACCAALLHCTVMLLHLRSSRSSSGSSRRAGSTTLWCSISSAR